MHSNLKLSGWANKIFTLSKKLPLLVGHYELKIWHLHLKCDMIKCVRLSSYK